MSEAGADGCSTIGCLSLSVVDSVEIADELDTKSNESCLGVGGGSAKQGAGSSSI